MKRRLLLAAAGTGSRLGKQEPKALVTLTGRPLLAWTLDRFVPLGLAAGAVVLGSPGMLDAFKRIVDPISADPPIRVVEGGAERQLSVRNGLHAIDSGTDVVLIHDAARPFISADAIEAVAQAAMNYGAATVAIPAVDTILIGDGEDFLESTPPRERLWQCQTPQAFRFDVIMSAHEQAVREGITVTDDATLVKHFGARVKLVNGSPLNFKITTPADLAYAEYLIAQGLV